MAAGVPVNEGNLSNLRDILTTYNKITDLCFNACVSNLNYYNMTEEEETCIQRCSGKYVNGNNKIMATFMQVQSKRQQTMIEEAEKKEKERLAGLTPDPSPQLPGQASAANILFSGPTGAPPSNPSSPS